MSDLLYAKTIYFNLGSHTEFYNAVQTGSSGEKKFFELRPTLGVGMSSPFLGEFKFKPEFNWVLPHGKNEFKIIKNLLMIRADLVRPITSWLDLRVGTSVMWLSQQGQGGSTTLSNGNSQSSFYYPDEFRSSFNNTIDLGLELFPSPLGSLRLQTYWYAPFKEERRQVSYTLFLCY